MNSKKTVLLCLQGVDVLADLVIDYTKDAFYKPRTTQDDEVLTHFLSSLWSININDLERFQKKCTVKTSDYDVWSSNGSDGCTLFSFAALYANPVVLRHIAQEYSMVVNEEKALRQWTGGESEQRPSIVRVLTGRGESPLNLLLARAFPEEFSLDYHNLPPNQDAAKQCVEFLLQQEPSYANYAPEHHHSPLFCSLFWTDPRITKTLLDAGARFNKHDEEHWTYVSRNHYGHGFFSFQEAVEGLRPSPRLMPREGRSPSPRLIPTEKEKNNKRKRGVSEQPDRNKTKTKKPKLAPLRRARRVKNSK
jgi:hypothetical protein